MLNSPWLSLLQLPLGWGSRSLDASVKTSNSTHLIILLHISFHVFMSLPLIIYPLVISLEEWPRAAVIKEPGSPGSYQKGVVTGAQGGEGKTFVRLSLFFYCSGQALSEHQETILMPVVTRFTLLTAGTSYLLHLLSSSPLKCSEDGGEPQKHTSCLPVPVHEATSSPCVHL